jgi:long-chain acyl-CoA synthetase
MNQPWVKSYDIGVAAEIDTGAYGSLADLLERGMGQYNTLAALECFGQTMTFGELEERSRAFAAYLQSELGVKTGDRIALMAPNVPAFVIAMYGIIRAGAIQVNVNPLYTPSELQHQLEDSGADTIVIFGGSTSTLAKIVEHTPIRRVITVDLGDGTGLPIPSPAVDPALGAHTRLADALEKGAMLPFTKPALTLSDTVFFQYTGGTTGPSKGAVLSHGNVVAAAQQFRTFVPQAMREGEEVLVAALPLYHIFGLVFLLAYAAIGGKAILIPNPRDMAGFIAAIKDKRISALPGVNTLFAGMMMHPDFRSVDFSNFRVAVGGGAAVLKSTSDQFQAMTGHPIKEGYGLSETSALIAINPTSMKEFSGKCGLPVPSTDVILLDDEDRRAGVGERGEICVKGPQVMSGYWQKPEANANAFTPDGYFRTGDIGVFDEQGFLQIVDRKKDMIIVSGFNVFPNEIEASVSTHAAILEAACIGVPDERTGEAVKVFAVRKPGADVSVDEIVRHCRESLTAYKVPRQVVFVEALPKSNVGKILRRELRGQ